MKTFNWGTYGINGTDPLQVKPIETLSTNHLLNILITETWHMPLENIICISNILKERGVKFEDDNGDI